MYNLKNDPGIIIKGAGRDPLSFSLKEDCLKEAYRQLEDKEVYKQVPNNTSVLVNTSMQALESIALPGDLSKDALNYFLVYDPKLARFYLLSKIRK